MKRREKGFESPGEFFRWVRLIMQPGIGLKRWLFVAFAGVLVMAMGIAFAMSASVADAATNVGRTATFANTSLGAVFRGSIFIGLGLLLVLAAAFMFFRRIALGARYSQGQASVIESLSRHQARRSGMRVVAIGGGTGLSSALRGLKNFTDNITAVVTVADDGGSSGKLRSELGISPPGDARQCLIALSESEPLMERLLTHRFEGGGAALQGHNLGNLLIAALVQTEGSFHQALEATAELLVVHGRVVPSTLADDVRLKARTAAGNELDGETAIGHAGAPIEEIWIEPRDAVANPTAVQAIVDADVIVIGPGSLYTSVLPNFLVHGMAEAVQASSALKIFVCNIATQPGETDDMTSADHINVFERISGVRATHFLMNDNIQPIEPPQQQRVIEPVDDVPSSSAQVVFGDLLDDSRPNHHDSRKLADAIRRLVRS
jgi:uncharacterized cofD-like protein